MDPLENALMKKVILSVGDRVKFFVQLPTGTWVSGVGTCWFFDARVQKWVVKRLRFVTPNPSWTVNVSHLPSELLLFEHELVRINQPVQVADHITTLEETAAQFTS